MIKEDYKTGKKYLSQVLVCNDMTLNEIGQEQAKINVRPDCKVVATQPVLRPDRFQPSHTDQPLRYDALIYYESETKVDQAIPKPEQKQEIRQDHVVNQQPKPQPLKLRL